MYASIVDTRAQSNDLDLVSVVAEAANRSNTRTYQTVSGDTTNAPVSTTNAPGGAARARAVTRSHAGREARARRGGGRGLGTVGADAGSADSLPDAVFGGVGRTRDV